MLSIGMLGFSVGAAARRCQRIGSLAWARNSVNGGQFGSGKKSIQDARSQPFAGLD
jgi:hypothetical protein